MRRADAGHDAAAEQPRHGGGGVGIDLRALAGGHERLVDEGPDAQRRRQLGAVLEGHPLGGVVGVEAVPGRPRRHARHSPQTARQLRMTKSPGATSVTPSPTASTDAGRLVTEQERELVVDAALAIVQVGVAHTARLDPHDRLTRSGVGHQDGLHRDGRALSARDDPQANLLGHLTVPPNAGNPFGPCQEIISRADATGMAPSARADRGESHSRGVAQQVLALRSPSGDPGIVFQPIMDRERDRDGL